MFNGFEFKMAVGQICIGERERMCGRTELNEAIRWDFLVKNENISANKLLC